MLQTKNTVFLPYLIEVLRNSNIVINRTKALLSNFILIQIHFIQKADAFYCGEFCRYRLLISAVSPSYFEMLPRRDLRIL